MRYVGIFATLLMAGCATFSGEAPSKAAPGSVLRQCQDAAASDTSIVQYAAANAGVSGGPNSYPDLLASLRRQSIDRCLQQNGAMKSGGVERVKQ